MTTKIPVELSSTPSIVDNGDATAITIDSSENVGIGTSSPIRPLHLHGGTSGDIVFAITNNSTGATTSDGFNIIIEGPTPDVLLRNRENSNMRFLTNNTERMRIDSSGKILFNTTSTLDANTLLHVGGINNNFNGMVFRNSSDVSTIFPIFFQNASGTLVGSINNNGSSTTFSGTSDYRLKENIQPMEKGLERVKKLKPVKFDWKETGESSEGFIAHEIQEAGWSLGVVGEKDGKEMQEVEYGKLTPLLVKAIQEQQTIIEDLQTQINEVKNGN